MAKEGSKARKVWVALFVCGSTRAVHLESVSSLSTAEFIPAYQQFVSQWGEPTRIQSDNATTFVAGAKLLKVDWLFNPPAELV